MAIKLIVTDLDGTFLNTNHVTIPKEIICAVPSKVIRLLNASINICGNVAMIPAIIIKLVPFPIPF